MDFGGYNQSFVSGNNTETFEFGNATSAPSGSVTTNGSAFADGAANGNNGAAFGNGSMPQCFNASMLQCFNASIGNVTSELNATSASNWIDGDFELDLRWMTPMSTAFELMVIAAVVIFLVVVGCARAIERVRTLRESIFGSAAVNENEPRGCFGGFHMHFSTTNMNLPPPLGESTRDGSSASETLAVSADVVVASDNVADISSVVEIESAVSGPRFLDTVELE